MAEAEAIKYRAFLSYSHADTSMARRLHARLENFRIDKELVGRKTGRGPIPASLRPIFRDREDFSGGSSLNEATISALDASAALIVLCSTVSACRPAVNEEVRLFRARHPDRLVIPVILDGTYPDNFPPALRFELNPDGTVSDRPMTILGPDLRESGDGFDLGFAKIVAPFLGLAPDDVYRRAERARRKQARLRNGAIAAILIPILVGGYFFYQSQQQAATLAEIDALVAKYSVVGPAAAVTPGAKQSLTQAITAIAEGAATDPRYAEALALLKAGKPAEAEPLLKAVAEDKAKRADKDAKDAAAAYRNLAAIAAVSDHKRAREYYAEAMRLDPSNVGGLVWAGMFEDLAGQWVSAEAAFERAITLAKPGTDDEFAFYAYIGMGILQTQQNNLVAALASFNSAKKITGNMPQAELSKDSWQGALETLNFEIGYVLAGQRDFSGAVKAYREAIALAQENLKSNPNALEWRWALLANYQAVGNALAAQGDSQGALDSDEEAVGIATNLVRSNPDNVYCQTGLAFSDQSLGDVLFAKLDLAGALRYFRDSLDIFEQLEKKDPDNSEWRRSLSQTRIRIGDALLAQGDARGAAASYQIALDIAERLPDSDQPKVNTQRNLAAIHNKIGEALLAEPDLVGALAQFQRALDMTQDLIRTNSQDEYLQSDLALSYGRLAIVYLGTHDKATALELLQKGQAIMLKLAQHEPYNIGWKSSLAWFNAQIAAISGAQGGPSLPREPDKK